MSKCRVGLAALGLVLVSACGSGSGSNANASASVGAKSRSNAAPVAQNLTVQTPENTALDGQLVATSRGNKALTYSDVTAPAHGSVIVNPDGAFTYTPATEYHGADRFTFKASDKNFDSNVATVSITVTLVNDPPVAQDQTITVAKDAPFNGRLIATDEADENETLTYSAVGAPAHGAVTINPNDGSFSYAPAAGYLGADTFTYKANDGQLDSNVATVSITVKNLLVVGAAKRSIQPCDGSDDGEGVCAQHGNHSNHIGGLVEERDFGITAAIAGALGQPDPGEHLQYFNLGGYGINAGQNMPDAAAQIPAMVTTTEPATRRVFKDLAGTEENMNLRLFVVEQPDGTCPDNPASAVPAVGGVPSQVTSCNTAVVFAMMDAIGAGNIILQAIKNQIIQAGQDQKDASGKSTPIAIRPENILFGLTHSHTANDLQGLWGGVPQKWLTEVVYPAAYAAAFEALHDAKAAHLNFRQGYTNGFNNYRRPRIDPNAHADGTITLLEAKDDFGGTIGSILQYNTHPTTVGDGNKPRTPHAEYIWGATKWLEDHEGGTALYYNGPIADASPTGSRPGCVNPEATNPDPSASVFGEVRCRGEGIADYLLHPENVITTRELDPTLEARSTKAVLPVTNPLFLSAAAAGSFNRYYNFTQLPTDQIPGLTPEQAADLPQAAPVAITAVSRITLGGEGHGLEIVSIPGETTNTYGNYIRGLAKTNVMLLGLTHNSFGYILPEEEFSYVNQQGKSGFVFPFTGYEEYVSLGPLTATLLRSEAYVPLFNAPIVDNVPPGVANCTDGTSNPSCAVTVAENRINVAIGTIESCVENGWRSDGCFAGAFQNLDPITQPIAKGCTAAFGSNPVCDFLHGGGAGPQPIPALDARLVAASADAEARGCDMLDTSACLFPFPNDWFTVPAAHGAPQGVDSGGTGKRINFNPLAMPRNAAGRPIDPTEWNRNDGYSPGQLIVTYVPGIGTVKGQNKGGVLVPIGPITGAVPINDLSRYLDDDAPIMVLDAATGERHPIYAEIDLNVGYLLPMQGFGPRDGKKPALLIRPSKNFLEGHRYVVVLRNLKNDDGQPIFAGPAFTACRDLTHGQLSAMPIVQSRCDELATKVFPVLQSAGIQVQGNRGLYLAWDFTVASAQNNIGRLKAMRDDAFKNYLRDTSLSRPGDTGYPAGDAPKFVVTKVTENPDGPNGNTVRRIHGSFTVPSYVIPADPSPLDGSPAFAQVIQTLAQSQPQQFGALRQLCEQAEHAGAGAADPLGIYCDAFDPAGSAPTVASLSLPPNRLNYLPDASSANVCDPKVPDPACVTQARYGNGLPKRNPTGDLTTTFTCNIPRSAISGKDSMAHATTADIRPVRPTLYGHGLLGGQGEANGQASDFGARYGFMVCAADWFGFAAGDLGNVAGTLADLSNFAVVPDGSQQGVLNQLFLARLAVHPNGFANDSNFQVGGQPVFDRREVFYDGNSQGGIMGGVVVAASPDVNRGVLGVPGMNYSTLLARSTDFATYSIPLYLAYQDDLDRPFVMSLMQMLWDRSENDGYAEHLSDNSALGGPSKQVLLTPSYGDHQVTMWSADVMARTLGASVDRFRITPERLAVAGYPSDPNAELGLPKMDYTNSTQAAGSELVPYDQVWETSNDQRCNTNSLTTPPPIGNVPPNRSNLLGTGEPLEDPSVQSNAGGDPHECPRRDPQARCQMSWFLQAGGTLIDPSRISRTADATIANGGSCPDVIITGAPITGGSTQSPGYGTGLFGAVAQFGHDLNSAIPALTRGDVNGTANNAQTAVANLAGNVGGLPVDPSNPGATIAQDPQQVVVQTTTANRAAEAVVLTGQSFPDWSAPEARGLPNPYPSGVGGTGAPLTQPIDRQFGTQFYQRNAHNGTLIYPAPGAPVLAGVPVEQIAAYAFRDGAWVEIPVQVDERMPYFLANANSGFSFYSGTDQELTYVWDTESWAMTAGTCNKAYGNVSPDGKQRVFDRNGHDITGLAGPTPDPVPGLDNDDEIVFMASDAGDVVTDPSSRPADVPAGAKGQQVVLADPLDPSKHTAVYLFLKPEGSKFRKQSHYVNYRREINADQWVDRTFWADGDPLKIGTSNTGYGPNLGGTVCPDGTAGSAKMSDDRFPRDGLTVSTDAYQWHARGRWLVNEMHVAKPGQPGVYGPDLVDRWKGRAFQQSPDTNVSVVGFEDEQVNWEANSTLLGERCGPVRCMREIWGADSGTNVTKTETFYRDSVAYRYHVRVHPIPSDGLYTSWDYNRGAMIPTAEEAAAGVPGGRYFTVLRPQGVPIDGQNDDVGNVDGTTPIPGIGPGGGPGCFSPDDLKHNPQGGGIVPPNGFGRCPVFFDVADPTFNLLLAFDNWEQVSGKGNLGSLVYTFENKGATSYANPLVVPYYRDDECFDDGTGDDPVQRPYPGERSDDPRVTAGYSAENNGVPYADIPCSGKQGAYASHGVHYFFTGDTDNAFSPVTTTEIDGQQWQFAVPTDKPTNVAEPYANTVRVPLQTVVTPLAPSSPSPPASSAGNPDLSALCASYGVPNSAPVCAQMLGAEQQLEAQCTSSGLPVESCSLAAGNLHALIDTCYGEVQSRLDQNGASRFVVCNTVQVVMAAAASYCRQLAAGSQGALHPPLCALIGGLQISEQAIDDYEKSWTHRALALQSRLGYGLPFLYNTLLATHNSFNATADNLPPTLSGSDPNQLYSITDQLRMDIRQIEVDVHWRPAPVVDPTVTPDPAHSQSVGWEPRVCHAETVSPNTISGSFPSQPAVADFGCTYEKPVREVLAEIRAWLDAHPDEQIILYIEDHLAEPGDDRAVSYPVTAKAFEDVLGRNSARDLVYRPDQHGSVCNAAASASDPQAWINVTRTQMAQAGKQVLLIGESCDDASGWSALFHHKQDSNVHQGTQSSFANFSYENGCRLPDEAAFITGSRGQRLSRVWEDGTWLTSTPAGGGSPAPVTPAVMHELVRCGLNLPGVDHLYPTDGRLDAAVWSWAPGQPAVSATPACAALDANGRFYATDCTQHKPFACVSTSDPDLWQLAGGDAWNGGATACPADFRFSVPANGYANEQLKAVAHGAEVWLNYSDPAGSGQWIGDASALPAAQAVGAPPAAGGVGATCRRFGLPEVLCSAADGLPGGNLLPVPGA